jgi:hypothetical protein
VSSIDFLRRRLVVAEAMIEVHGHLVWGAPKSHEARSVPIPRVLFDDLAAQVEGKYRNDLAFTTAKGAPLRNRNARRPWFDDAATASVSRASPRTSCGIPPLPSRSAPAQM